MSKEDAPIDMKALLSAVGETRDVAAFEQLFRYYGPRLKSYMVKLCKDNQQAEELMQEAMLVVWHKAHLFDGSKGAASTWIFTIARNLRIDAIRKHARPEFDPHDPAFVPEPHTPADIQMGEKQSRDKLHEALLTLPREQADLLKLAYFEDISQSAIAERLSLPLGTVKSRMRLAFEKLRYAFEKTGDAK